MVGHKITTGAAINNKMLNSCGYKWMWLPHLPPVGSQWQKQRFKYKEFGSNSRGW